MPFPALTMQTEEQVRACVRAVPGERYVYDVPSDRNKGKAYRFDLTGNNGAGVCQCRDWQIRRQPALDRGEPPLTQATLCKHGRRAIWFFVRDLLPALAKQEQTPRRPAPAPTLPAPQPTRPAYEGYC